MTLRKYLSGKRYPGRVIIAGVSLSGQTVLLYAIMGRSDNSRNRIFRLDGSVLRTEPYKRSEVEDPSLIIYSAERESRKYIVLSNGDHTDTIMDALEDERGLEYALAERSYEPDKPHYTPRICAVVNKEDLSYSLSIIKRSEDGKAERKIYSYKGMRGICHVIHTYMDDSEPLIPFSSDPPSFELCDDDIDALAESVWESLDEDNRISLYVRIGGKKKIINRHERELKLKYGCNPNQKNSMIKADFTLPIKVLNGRAGYVNLLDALNGYQLVKELKASTGLPAAASFKHVSPAGASVYVPLSDKERKMYFVKDDEDLSPLSVAYIRARGADRMSSFGDFIALSDTCDRETARAIQREVSDGIIAPGYAEEALEILKKKKKGSYCIIETDPEYVMPKMETRTVYGITFTQDHNDYIPSDKDFLNAVTENKEISEEAKRDLTVALLSLKYTQSNSVCYARNGQTIGVGAGQQSRIHCTRLAGAKADLWNLRQAEKVLSLPFKENLSRNDKDNIIEQYLSNEPEIDIFSSWPEYFSSKPDAFTKEEKRAYLDKIKGISLASDAFFPFRDNIDRASRSGVSFISEPGGSVRDSDVIKAANEHGMTMFFTGARLFHH